MIRNCLIILFLATTVRATDRPNVLFIAVDDLRPALGCYGDRTAITPNIDRLAKRGMVFERAYCQQAVCSPSRLSLITGRRPDTIKVWDLGTHFRKAVPAVVTLPQFFKENGYHVRSIGKILHGSGSPAKDPISWSVQPVYDVNRDPKFRYATEENLTGKGLKRRAAEMAEVGDEAYLDGLICREALKALKSHDRNSSPFFLAVGFKKPHLPFCAPRKYWDLYDRDAIPLPSNASHPEDAPELATRSWKELEGYTDIPSDRRLSREKAMELRHGYYACVSYVDSLVGRLLDQLVASGLAENTVVCLWGDHGFHLGEQGLWTKANNYELSARVPLLFCHPGKTRAGSRTDALVELVDVYPTVTELCGMKLPGGLEGTSLLPLIKDPGLSWKKAAFTQYPRSGKSHRHRGHGDVMGYAIRTDSHRYVEWREWSNSKVVVRELYDHRTDADEMKNVASHKEHKAKVVELSKLLNAGWRASLPPGNSPSKP
ncbi:MAG: sulfatase [Pirellulales bacterium]